MSYISPSRRLTDFLSEYLEFDPTQLSLGLWGGDLSLRNVSLRKEAVDPLLDSLVGGGNDGNSGGAAAGTRKRSRPPDLEPPPLGLTLLSGTVGRLRLVVPWKTLVVGSASAPVDVVLEDLTVVLGLCAPLMRGSGIGGGSNVIELGENGRMDLGGGGARGADGGESNRSGDGDYEEARSVLIGGREEKQWRLAEAERRHLRKLPIPGPGEWRQADPAPGAGAEDAAVGASAGEPGSAGGMLDGLLRSAASTLVWRLLSNLRAKVRNLRVVLVVDGVEIGLTIDSIDVGYWPVDDGNVLASSFQEALKENDPSSDDEKDPQSQSSSDFVSESSVGAGRIVRRRASLGQRRSSDAIHGPAPDATRKGKGGAVVASGGVEDGSFGKVVKILGLGAYIGPTTTETRPVRTPLADHSVVPTQALPPQLLRTSPNDYILKPYNSDIVVTLLRTSFSGTSSLTGTAATVEGIDMNSSEASSSGEKLRQSSDQVDLGSSLDKEVSDDVDLSHRTSKRVRRGKRDKNSIDSSSISTTSDVMVKSDASTPHLDEGTEPAGGDSSLFSPDLKSIDAVHESEAMKRPKEIKQPPATIRTPQLVVRSHLGGIHFIFSQRQLNLIHSLLSSSDRIRHGRPQESIKTVLRGRFIFEGITSLPSSPNLGLVRSASTPDTSNLVGSEQRGAIVKQWWWFAYDNVARDIRRRRVVLNAFRHRSKPFNWTEQSFLRNEYIDLYTRVHLDQRSNWVCPESLDVMVDSNILRSKSTDQANDSDRKREEELLALEDQLPIEQLLLYRSIARSLQITGNSRVPIVKVGNSGRAEEKLSLAKPQGFGPLRRSVSRGPALSKDRKQIPELGLNPSFLRDYKPVGIKSNTDPPCNRHSAFDRFRSDAECTSSFNEDSEAMGGDGTFSSRGSSSASTVKSMNTRGITRPTLHRKISSSSRDRIAKDSTRSSHERANTATSGMTELAAVFEDEPLVGSPDLGREMDSDFCSWQVIDEAMEAEMDAKPDVGAATAKQLPILLTFALDKISFSLSSRPLGPNGNVSRHQSQKSWDNISVLTGVLSDHDDEASASVFPAEKSEDFPVAGRSTPSDCFMARIDTVKLRIRGRSGGKKSCSFSVGDIECRIGERRVVSVDSLGVESGSVLAATLERLQSLDSVSERKRKNPFAAGILSIDYVSTNYEESNQKSQHLTACYVDFAKIQAVVDIKGLDRFSRFISRDFDMYPSHNYSSSPIPFWDEYTQLVSTNTGGKWIRNIEFSLGVAGLEFLLPAISDPSQIIMEIMSLQICSVAFSGQGVAQACWGHVKIRDGSPDSIIADTDGSWVDPHTSSCVQAGENKNIKFDLLLNPAEILDKDSSQGFSHVQFSIRSMDFVVRTDDNQMLKITRDPIDCDCVISVVNSSNEMASFIPRLAVTAKASSAYMLLSKERFDVIFSVFMTMKERFGSTCKTEISPELRPRIAELASAVLTDVQFSASSISLIIESDEDDQRKSLQSIDGLRVREILLEETVSDFLSHLSCFDLECPQRDVMTSSTQICVNRLVALGLSREEASECTKIARDNFLSDLKDMKAHILVEVGAATAELSTSEEDLAMPNISNEGIEDDTVATESAPDVDNDQWENDSTESFDIIETTLKNAVEKTVAAAIPRLGFGHDEAISLLNLLVVTVADGIDLSFTNYSYDHVLILNAGLVEIKNGKGSQFMRILPVDREGSKLEEAVLLPANHGAMFVLYEKDGQEEAGGGGYSRSLLSDPVTAMEVCAERRRETCIDFNADSVNIIFSESDVSDAVLALASLTSSLRLQDDDESVPSAFFLVSGSVKHMSVIFSSDEMVPFARCLFGNTTFERSSASKSNRCSAKVRMKSSTFDLQDLTPEGQNYTSVVSTFCENKPPESPCFSVTIDDPHDIWSEPMQLELDIIGVRIFVLRRFINELMQFFHNPLHGVEKFLTKFRTDHGVDVNGNPPPPTRYHISLSGSSLVFPVSSESKDLLAVEANKIYVSNFHVSESWDLNEEDLNCNPDCLRPVYNLRNPANMEGGVRSERNATEDSFYDCMESCLTDTLLNSSQKKDLEPDISMNRISAHDINWFERIKIEMNSTQVFTALIGSDFLADMPSEVQNSLSLGPERAKSGKPVYRNESLRQQPLWTEVTSCPADLELLVDFVPQLRILIRDHVDRKTTPVPLASTFDLDMQRDHFYLILSVWYKNMQELPRLFPFSESTIVDNAVTPPCPEDWPEYGTRLFTDRLKQLSPQQFEMALYFHDFHWRCYFQEDVLDGANAGIVAKPTAVIAKNFAFRMKSDEKGLLRVACTSDSFEIVDCCEDRLSFPHIFAVTNKGLSGEGLHSTRADLSWGLDCSRQTLLRDLSYSFQLSVFMSPDNSCLVNLGLNAMDGTSADLSSIWCLLEYFAAYFKDEDYGHPAFDAEKERRRARSILKAREGANSTDVSRANEDDQGMNIDFRLWLVRPMLIIPSNPSNVHDPCLSLENRGLYYRYKSIGSSFSSQEIVATGMAITMTKEYKTPLEARGIRGVTGADIGVRTLIENLSFGVLYEFDQRTNHMNVSARIPLRESDISDTGALIGIESSDLQVEPLIFPTPTVLKPILNPSRHLGPSICNTYFSYDYLELAFSQLVSFVSNDVDRSGTDKSHLSRKNNGESTEYTFSLCARLSGVRVFLSDPILGMHHPLAAVCIPSLVLSASRLSGRAFSDRSDGNPISEEILATKDLQAGIDLHLWIDHFKIASTRSWEPLIEAYKCIILYEKSSKRGQGLTFNSDCPLHANISGALLESIDDTINTFKSFRVGVFGKSKDDRTSANMEKRLSDYGLLESLSRNRLFDEKIASKERPGLCVVHQLPPALDNNDRVAFSLKNLTGDTLRVHQSYESSSSLSESHTRIAYVDHAQSSKLRFPATMSTFCNLQVVEVPFETPFEGSGAPFELDHTVDVQIPGFKWVTGISVDNIGRRFHDLVPRSLKVSKKLLDNWQLCNAVKLLSEAGSSWSGGREVTLSSVFTISNRTSHQICLAFHPDSLVQPSDSPSDRTVKEKPSLDAFTHNTVCGESEFLFDALRPGEFHRVPFGVIDAALHHPGNDLGALWLKPQDISKEASIDRDLLESLMHAATAPGTDSSASVQFSSRPVQLAKIVHESASMYARERNRNEPQERNRFNSGLQVSCPIVQDNNEVSFAPFCYVIEVKRSPLIPVLNDKICIEKEKSSVQQEPLRAQGRAVKQTGKPDKSGKERSKEHGPVQYSLAIHPPLVIENLLSESGRFELMHATRGVVVWWADLKAGERIPVHTVGLDAPLLLLINLGFCRTPVGEGALVHHGSTKTLDKRTASNPAGFQAIGKVVNKSKQTVSKTLTTISEGESRRGKGRLATLTSPKYYRNPGERVGNRDIYEKKKAVSFGFEKETEDYGIDGGDGRSELSFSLEDVATETTIVDSLGQRLDLSIENNLGSGGQRHITVYCPFWILNTTEHSLRYKQDKTALFVSGTVSSPSKDGSKAVDDSNRYHGLGHTANDFDGVRSRRGTVFSGTPGALAKCDINYTDEHRDLVRMLSKDIPLNEMAAMAFMFNFYETVLGQQKLSVQLHSGTQKNIYSSDWSMGFSLESVGVTQIVGLHCKDRRVLELSVSIGVAPGRLSQFTKIIRFSPRYVLVNQLNRPIRLWQDNSLIHSNYAARNSPGDDATVHSHWYESDSNEISVGDESPQYDTLFGKRARIDNRSASGIPRGSSAHSTALYIATASPSGIVPFHLPDTRADRQLRIDFGTTHWNLTSSFPADVDGDHYLKVSRVTDSRLIRHVSTRAALQYTVELPPQDTEQPWDGELGVWFETDWGDGHIIVKGTKRGKYFYNSTDIHVGDELLSINGALVSQMTFEETMTKLKEEIAALPNIDRNKLSLKPAQLLKNISINRPTSGIDSINISAQGADETIAREINQGKLVLTFRTVEERMRRIRSKAVKKAKGGRRLIGSTSPDLDVSRRESEHPKRLSAISNSRSVNCSTEESLSVQMKFLHQSIFVLVKSTSDAFPPYRIENRAINHTVYFRQRGCDGHPWSSLAPGDTTVYAWEEPTKPKKLTVRVGLNLATIQSSSKRNRERGHSQSEKGAKRRKKRLLRLNTVDDEEEGGYSPLKTIRLEQIGFEDYLPCPTGHFSRERSINQMGLACRVDTDGATRVLIVSDATQRNVADEDRIMSRHLSTLKRQIEEEQKRFTLFDAMRKQRERSGNSLIIQTSLDRIPEESDVDNLGANTSRDQVVRQAQSSPDGVDIDLTKQIGEIADYPDGTAITNCHQVLVEVLEAADLKPSDLSGLSNPYAVVSLKERYDKRRNAFLKRKKKHKTYFIEKTLAPKWSQQPQIFIFDIPAEASKITRGVSIRIEVKSFSTIGSHTFLGRTDVHLRSIFNQKESVGWYPLTGNISQRELDSPLSRIRGSVKLRVQWVHSSLALLDYYILLSQSRLKELERSREGMKRQLAAVIESNQRRKNDMIEPLSLVKLPTMTRMEGKLLRRAATTPAKSILIRNVSSPKLLSARPVLSPQPRGTFNLTLRQTMKAAREKYLWALHFETAASKSFRQLTFDDPANSPGIDQGSNDVSFRQRFGTSASPRNDDGTMNASPLSARNDEMSLDFNFGTAYRARASSLASLGEVFSSQSRMNSLTTQNGLILQRMRSFSKGAGSLEEFQSPRSNFDGSFPEEDDDLGPIPESGDTEAQRFDDANNLYDLGLLFHESGSYFHRLHTTKSIRVQLEIAPLAQTTKSLQGNCLKSTSHCLESTSEFSNWSLAQTYLNDEYLRSEVLAKPIPTKLRKSPQQRKERDEGVTLPLEGELFSLPISAPSLVHNRASTLAKHLRESRSSFARTCERSLKQVLNPGGWLTVRPISALNLPDTFPGISVKLRYGSTVLISETADGKVTPKWTSEGDRIYRTRSSVPSTPTTPRVSNYTSSKSGSMSSEVADTESNRPRSESDLQIYVEPLKTSGIIRLSVVGEKLQSRVELGVLQINIAAALNCCLDSGEETDGALKYTRWFPLVDPKACTPMEGDMGLSSRPPESEKWSDTDFSQYFTPCIKLALIWSPDAYNKVYDSNLGVSASPGSPDNFELRRSVTEMYVQGYIDSLSASLVDTTRAKELLSFCSTDIDLRYSITRPKTRLGMAVGWIQLDHQLKAREPVCVAPTPVSHPQPTLQFLAVKDNLKSKANVDSYEYIAAALQELDIRIEEVWLLELWDFFNRVMKRRDAKRSVWGRTGDQRGIDGLCSGFGFSTEEADQDISNELSDMLRTEIYEPPSQSADGGKVYITKLLLDNVKLNLSYIKSSKNRKESATTGANDLGLDIRSAYIPGFSSMNDQADDRNNHATDARMEMFRRWSEGDFDGNANNAESKASSNLPNIISAVFPAFTGAPVRLQGKTIEHVFESGSEILASLRNYYVNEILRQVYKIIGSLDFVGNPTMVVSSVLTGVRDFFLAPSREFLRSPKDPTRVGLGLAKGTLSLVSHSATGIFGFASKMSATAGQGVAQLSFDDYYKQWHGEHAIDSENYGRKKTSYQIAVSGLLRPAQDVVFGALFGASGVIVEPYRGFKQDKVAGLAKGIGLGIIGAGVKPVVGLFDAFAHFTEAIHDLAKDINVLEKKFEPVQKRRLPHVFGLMDLLTPFNIVSATSMLLLKRFPFQSDSRPEVIVVAEVLHMEPGIDKYTIVSTRRVALFNVRLEKGGSAVPSLLWQIPFGEGVDVKSIIESRGHNGISICITSIAHNESTNDSLQEEGTKVFNPPPLPSEGNGLEADLTTHSHASLFGFVRDSSALDEETDHNSQLNISNPPDKSFFDVANQNVKDAAKAIALHAGNIVTLPTIQQLETGQGRARNPIKSPYHGKLLDQRFVLGEFQDRKSLIRIHNAICCVSKHFDLIMYDGGVGFGGSKEGLTVFGHLIFKDDSIKEASANDHKRNKHDFYNILEEVAWLHDVDTESREEGWMEKSISSIKSRKLWQWSDEVESSKRQGGPSWLIESRARSMFVPPPPPPVPGNVGLSDEFVMLTLGQLRDGGLNYEQARENIHAYAEDLSQSPALRIQSTLTPTTPTNIPVPLEDMRNHRNNLELEHTQQTLADVSAFQEKLEIGTHEQDSIANAEFRMTGEAQSFTASGIGSHVGVNERLDRVVDLLEQLITIPNQVNPYGTIPLSTLPMSSVDGGTTTTGGASLAESTDAIALRQEVEELRRELAESRETQRRLAQEAVTAEPDDGTVQQRGEDHQTGTEQETMKEARRNFDRKGMRASVFRRRFFSNW